MRSTVPNLELDLSPTALTGRAIRRTGTTPNIHPQQHALVLDLHGTLCDPLPFLPEGPVPLATTLDSIFYEMGGATAVLSGSSVEEIEVRLGQGAITTIGTYGAEARIEGVYATFLPHTPLPNQIAHLVRQFFGHVVGVAIFESKPAIRVVIENDDQLEDFVRDVMEQIAESVMETHYLIERHRSWELVPRGLDKGRAIEELMTRAPFAGRLPIYVGDDYSDLPALEAVARLGGAGYRVGIGASDGGNPVFPDVASVVRWLDRQQQQLSCEMLPGY